MSTTALNAYPLNTNALNDEPIEIPYAGQDALSFSYNACVEASSSTLFSLGVEAGIDLLNDFNFQLEAVGAVYVYVENTGLNSYPLNTNILDGEPKFLPTDLTSTVTFEVVAQYTPTATNSFSLTQGTQVEQSASESFSYVLDAQVYAPVIAEDTALNSFSLNTYPLDDALIKAKPKGSVAFEFTQEAAVIITAIDVLTFDFEATRVYAPTVEFQYELDATGSPVIFVTDTALNSFILNTYPIDGETVFQDTSATDNFSFIVESDYEMLVDTTFSFNPIASYLLDTQNAFSFEILASVFQAIVVNDTALNSYPLNSYPLGGRTILAGKDVTNTLIFEVEATGEVYRYLESSFTFEQVPKALGVEASSNEYSFTVDGSMSPDGKDEFYFLQTITQTTVVYVEDTALNSFKVGSYPLDGYPLKSIQYTHGSGTLVFEVEAYHERVEGSGYSDLVFEPEHTYFVGHLDTSFSFLIEAEVASPIHRGYAEIVFEQETTAFAGHVVELLFSFGQEISSYVVKPLETELSFEVQVTGPPDGDTYLVFETEAAALLQKPKEDSFRFEQLIEHVSLRFLDSDNTFKYDPVAIGHVIPINSREVIIGSGTGVSTGSPLGTTIVSARPGPHVGSIGYEPFSKANNLSGYNNVG